MPSVLKTRGAVAHHRRFQGDIAGIGFEGVGDALVNLRIGAVTALTEARPRRTGQSIEVKTKTLRRKRTHVAH